MITKSECATVRTANVGLTQEVDRATIYAEGMITASQSAIVRTANVGVTQEVDRATPHAEGMITASESTTLQTTSVATTEMTLARPNVSEAGVKGVAAESPTKTKRTLTMTAIVESMAEVRWEGHWTTFEMERWKENVSRLAPRLEWRMFDVTQLILFRRICSPRQTYLN